MELPGVCRVCVAKSPTSGTACRCLEPCVRPPNPEVNGGDVAAPCHGHSLLVFQGVSVGVSLGAFAIGRGLWGKVSSIRIEESKDLLRGTIGMWQNVPLVSGVRGRVSCGQWPPFLCPGIARQKCLPGLVLAGSIQELPDVLSRWHWAVDWFGHGRRANLGREDGVGVAEGDRAAALPRSQRGAVRLVWEEEMRGLWAEWMAAWWWRGHPRKRRWQKWLYPGCTRVYFKRWTIRARVTLSPLPVAFWEAGWRPPV